MCVCVCVCVWEGNSKPADTVRPACVVLLPLLIIKTSPSPHTPIVSAEVQPALDSHRVTCSPEAGPVKPVIEDSSTHGQPSNLLND